MAIHINDLTPHPNLTLSTGDRRQVIVRTRDAGSSQSEVRVRSGEVGAKTSDGSDEEVMKE
jgi:hypothetical protein